MRNLKRLGLVATAAIALIAVAGVSSAFAAKTTLCKSNAYSPFCLGADGYPSGTSLQASSSNVKIEFTNPEHIEVNCSESGLSGTSSGESAEPLSASLHWTLGGCEAHWPKESGTCKVDEGNEPPTGYSVGINGSSGGNGTVAFSGGSEGHVGWRLTCGTTGGRLVRCRLSFPEPTFALTGGSPAVMAVNQGMNCSSSVAPTFSGTYTFSSPKPLYLERPGTEQAPGELRLCKTSGKPCTAANTYPVGTTLEAEASDFKLAFAPGSITCKKATLSAEVQSLGASLPVSVQYGFNECSGVFGSCNVTAAKSGGTLSYVGNEFGDAKFQTETVWDFNCTSAHCQYSTASAIAYGKSTNGATAATITYPAQEIKRANEICPIANELSVHYTVTKPSPLYFTTT